MSDFLSEMSDALNQIFTFVFDVLNFSYFETISSFGFMDIVCYILAVLFWVALFGYLAFFAVSSVSCLVIYCLRLIRKKVLEGDLK